jgi:hypothetical protein
MLQRWGGIRTSAVVVETSHGAGGFAFDHRMLQKLLVIMAGTVSAIMRAAIFFARTLPKFPRPRRSSAVAMD